MLVCIVFPGMWMDERWIGAVVQCQKPNLNTVLDPFGNAGI